jgi:hypothetical protein
VKADRLIHAGTSQLLIFGGTPIRPDGAGFLVMKNSRWPKWWDEKPGAVDPDPGFAFVDWQGREKPLTPPAFMLDAAALKNEHDGAKLGALLWPAYFDSGWQGDVAQVSWNVDRMRYRTGKGEAVLERIQPEKTKDGGLIDRQYQFPGTQVRVRTVLPNWDDEKAQGKGPTRLEVLKPRGRAPQVVLEQMTMPGIFIPSPDGKRVAVWTTTKDKNQKEEAVVLVVDDRGEVAARVSFPVKK